MTRYCKARAFANIALVKYWGKCSPGNCPATPSISLALEGLITETEVHSTKGTKDSILINGRTADTASRKRIKQYLDLWREKGLLKGSFHIYTYNRFPTRSGLASSASGYAALAMALSAFSNYNLSVRELSRLARQGSGSAARSIPGGLAALPAGKDPAARRLVAAENVPWGMIVAILKNGGKDVGSREGMELSRIASPYYQSWIRQAQRDYGTMLAALRDQDLERVGEIAEQNALAMHACMMATRPTLIYLSGNTLLFLRIVKSWRARGIQAYATMDAGPHVVLLTHRNDLARIAGLARAVDIVETVIESLPGGPAAILDSR